MTKIKIEVVYAQLHHQELVTLETSPDKTIGDVIEQSGLLETYPEIDLSLDNPKHNKVGIYNQIKPLDEVVKNGDRIEIYRKLIIDPKEVRRKRAQKQKEQGII